MNILVQLSHPAHFHLYKNVARNLIADGHQVHILIKSKDILEDLLKESGLPYENICTKAHRGNKLGILLDMLEREYKMLKYCRRNNIDLLTGSTPEVTHVGWLLGKYRINTGEDDAAIVPLFFKIAGWFIQTELSPTTCENGKFENKTVHYAGYHKLAYLHPNVFQPDKAIVSRYFDPNKPYFILRFAQLKAYHDGGAAGITTEIAEKLIGMLAPHGNVYITSERPLEPQFEKYRLQINPLEIHHVMAFADLYIGDSQSMAVEAAMLGVPNIRFNSFAGRIGVLEELQNKYQLTYGIHSSNPERLYSRVDELLSMASIRDEFQSRRQVMLSEKIDVTAFFTWFIENYPESRRKMEENPDYQYRFK